MNINDILKSGANVQLVVNALDLKEMFLQWSEEHNRNSVSVPEEKYLTAQEAAAKLGVDISTLDKTDFLKKIKVGKKIFYKESDILKLMEG